MRLPAHRLVPVVAAMIGLAGCSSQTPQPSRFPSAPPSPNPQHGTVTGTLELAAVIRTPPLRGTVYLHGVGGKTYTTITSGNPFSIRVPLGTYTLSGRSPQYQNGTQDCRAAGPITVAADATIPVEVDCQGF